MLAWRPGLAGVGGEQARVVRAPRWRRRNLLSPVARSAFSRLVPSRWLALRASAPPSDGRVSSQVTPKTCPRAASSSASAQHRFLRERAPPAIAAAMADEASAGQWMEFTAPFAAYPHSRRRRPEQQCTARAEHGQGGDDIAPTNRLAPYRANGGAERRVPCQALQGSCASPCAQLRGEMRRTASRRSKKQRTRPAFPRHRRR